MERSWIKNRNIPHSGSWQLALEPPLGVRACGFGPSRNIWRNAGITQSPLACRAQPHTVSSFLKTTLKWSGSTKCGLFDGTFTDFYTGWSHMTPQPSINQKQCLFCFFSTQTLVPKQTWPRVAQKCQSNEKLNYKDSCYCKWSKTITTDWVENQDLMVVLIL